jgi:hypothetical protein
MVLNAEDLTVHAVNPAYKQLLGDRDVKGLPMGELFNGRQLEELINLLRKAARESQTLHTNPIFTSVYGDHQGDSVRFVRLSPLAM